MGGPSGVHGRDQTSSCRSARNCCFPPHLTNRGYAHLLGKFCLVFLIVVGEDLFKRFSFAFLDVMVIKDEVSFHLRGQLANPGSPSSHITFDPT